MIVAALALELIVATHHCRDRQRGRDCRMAWGDSTPAIPDVFRAVTDADDATPSDASAAAAPYLVAPYLTVNGNAAFTQSGGSGGSSGTAVRANGGGAVATFSQGYVLNGESTNTTMQIGTTDGFWADSANMPAIAGTDQFTACSALTWDYVTGTWVIVWQNADAQFDFSLEIESSNRTLFFRRQPSPGSFLTVTSSNNVWSQNTPHAYCATYNNGAVKLFVDGTKVADSTISTSGGIAGAKKYLWSYSNDGGNRRTLGGFFVSTALSEANVLAVSQQLVPRFLTPQNGAAISNSRSTMTSCQSADTSFYTWIPPSQTCRNSDGIFSFSSATSIMYGLTPGDGTAWPNAGVSATTGERAPDGSARAALINDGVIGGAEGTYQFATYSGATTITFSCYLKAGTADELRLVIGGVGNTAGDTHCNVQLTSGWARYSCKTLSPYGAGLSQLAVSLNLGWTSGGVGSYANTDVAPLTGSEDGTGTYYANGCQVEERLVPTPLIFMPAAPATRAADRISSTGTYTYGTAPLLLFTAKAESIQTNQYLVQLGTTEADALSFFSTQSGATNRQLVGRAAYVGSTLVGSNRTTNPNRMTPSAPNDVRIVADGVGSPDITIGAQTAQVNAITGPTAPTSSSTIWLGTWSGATGREWNGAIKKICLADAATGCAGLP